MSPPKKVERAAVEAAIERILNGTPTLATPGEMTLSALMTESGVHDRNAFYRRLDDLRRTFQDRVEAVQADPPPATPRELELLQAVDRLQAENEELRGRVADLASRRDTLTATTRTLVRIINLLECEKATAQESSASESRQVARLEEEKADLEQRLYRLAESKGRQPGLTVLPGGQGEVLDPTAEANSDSKEDS